MGRSSQHPWRRLGRSHHRRPGCPRGSLSHTPTPTIPTPQRNKTTDIKNQKQDFSQQICHPPATPPPGPIEETALTAQRAALQALGLTGTYLEHGLRLAAEDVGWLTHTATFEDAVQKVQKRFPMLKKLGESYGKGARKESARRRESAPPVRGACQRLSREELAQFGAMEEVR